MLIWYLNCESVQSELVKW